MDQTKSRSTLRRWLNGTLFLIGAIFGLLDDLDDFKTQADPHENRTEALIVFGFFVAALILIWMVERFTLALVVFLQRVTGKRGQQPSRSDWIYWFFRACGCFSLGMGCGLILSGFWKDGRLIGIGLSFLAAGTGIMTGLFIARWLSKKYGPRPE